MQAKKHSLHYITQQAVKALRAGGTIVFPTETSYGLGADATSRKAVEKMAAVKQQPEAKEISVIISSLKQIEKYWIVTKETKKLVEKFFPGPLTLVARKKKNKLNWLGRKTIAFRVSSNKIAFEICRRFGKPITATSANIHGKPAIYSGKKVIKEFAGKAALIIDAGNLKKRKASTLFDVEGREVLRNGKIKEKEILKVLSEHTKKNGKIKRKTKMETKKNELLALGIESTAL